jgi:osmoprotectant transport system ATP-binding protein
LATDELSSQRTDRTGSAVWLRATNVQVRLAGREVLRDVRLDVSPGTCLAVLGPSGCGKSTLLRVVAGLVVPTSGEVIIDHAALTPASAPALRRRMGYVIQEGGLFPHLTARQNVTLAARFAGWTPERTRARVTDLCALCRLPETLLDRYPTELSGGQRQRVALARALLLEPGLLLLDEPFGALDPVVRAALQDELREVLRGGSTTAVLVTHDVAEAGWIGDRLLLLRDGRIEQEGALRDLVDAPATDFVREFVAAQRGVRDALERA